jgi:hypothetical protein
MAKLCGKADVIVPNLTEACFMTHTEYREDWDEAYIREVLNKLAALGAKRVVLTGICFEEGKTGFVGMDTATGEFFTNGHEKISASYHGTGDIFSSTAVGALIGFLIWAKNLIASGILTYFTRADVLQDVLNKAVGTPESVEEATNAVKNAGVSMLVIMLCGILCLVWTLTCLPYVAKKILRMACMHTNGKSRKKSKNTAKNIATDEVSFSSFKPLIGSLIPLIPMMFFDIKLPDEVYSAWIASIVGAVIIVAFEIALPILRKVFIRDFDAHNATYVCMGGVIADRDGN